MIEIVEIRKFKSITDGWRLPIEESCIPQLSLQILAHFELHWQTVGQLIMLEQIFHFGVERFLILLFNRRKDVLD
jgi:hypothetical protein